MIPLFSSLWVSYPVDVGFDFIVTVPLLLSLCGLSLDVGYLFLVGSSILLWIAVQQLGAVLVLSQEMSSHPSTPPS